MLYSYYNTCIVIKYNSKKMNLEDSKVKYLFELACINLKVENWTMLKIISSNIKKYNK